MWSKLLLCFVLCYALHSQPSIVLPQENRYHPGNIATYFAQDPGGVLGIVIDDLPQMQIRSISFRPNFYYDSAAKEFKGQVLPLLFSISSGPMSTFKMYQANHIDSATMQQPLGIYGSNVSFPDTKTAFPLIGLQAFLPESFSLVIPFNTPYNHNGGNLQIFMQWPGKNNHFPIAMIDTQIINDPYGMEQGVSITGNQSLVPTGQIPYFCFASQPPIIRSVGPLENPNQTYVELFSSGPSNVALFSSSLVGQPFNWTGLYNIPCSVRFDFQGCAAIPYSNYTALPIGYNIMLEKQFVSAIVGSLTFQGLVLSPPIVLTIPLTYPKRQFQGISPNVPTIRSKVDGPNNSEWVSVILGIN